MKNYFIKFLTFITILSFFLMQPKNGLTSIEKKDIVATIFHPKDRAQGKKIDPSESLILNSELSSLYSIPQPKDFETSLLPQLEMIIKNSPELAQKYLDKLNWYHDFHRELLARSLAQITLEKILTDYAQKQGISTQAHTLVVDFIFQNILKENARQMGVSENLAPKDLYENLKQRIETVKSSDGKLVREVTLKTQWSYSQEALQEIQKIVLDKNNSAYSTRTHPYLGLSLNFLQNHISKMSFYKTPHMTFTGFKEVGPNLQFTFTRPTVTQSLLPKTVDEFYKIIQNNLNIEHRRIVFQNILKYILEDKAKKYDLPQTETLSSGTLEILVFHIFNDHKIQVIPPYSDCPNTTQPCLIHLAQNKKELSHSLFRPILADFYSHKSF